MAHYRRCSGSRRNCASKVPWQSLASEARSDRVCLQHPAALVDPHEGWKKHSWVNQKNSLDDSRWLWINGSWGHLSAEMPLALEYCSDLRVRLHDGETTLPPKGTWTWTWFAMWTATSDYFERHIPRPTLVLEHCSFNSMRSRLQVGIWDKWIYSFSLQNCMYTQTYIYICIVMYSQSVMFFLLFNIFSYLFMTQVLPMCCWKALVPRVMNRLDEAPRRTDGQIDSHTQRAQTHTQKLLNLLVTLWIYIYTHTHIYILYYIL
jgi:hypothetical protein